MSKKRKKLLLATGGTGGHLFPAQAIAAEVINKLPDTEVLFAGAGLKTNRFFDRKRFVCCEVSSPNIFQRNILNLVKAPFQLLKGIIGSLTLMRAFKPTLVVGFGSFHTLPVLVAAKLCRVPIVLFEANACPGRVNRLFSRWAKWCAIYFPDAGPKLKTQTYLAHMPFWRGLLEKAETVTREEARAYLGLNKNKKTLLIFGGSQGASSINQVVAESLSELHINRTKLQIIHITGNTQAARELTTIYQRLGLDAVVKDFELHMHLVWPGVDLAISRAGASAIAEQINYEVPSILIPYPHAAGDHQMHNGHYMAHTVRGAELMREDNIESKRLSELLLPLLETKSTRLASMRESIINYKKITQRSCLSQLIVEDLR
ncbi:MAG: UDP-N-acetylglucosamine--N-acetylmuramyl-(pentapeptide) pyrophosphoryl-undecaprenol N-acetylglucosamine transferase [Chlamydiales bacterium]|nr:UDP-N-acetylglucosamine--N-acetylmuramyl-(pentapeptide) pyrophosphoryl-undecaprenol N-acetylglucosamine transferase [Chlamydiales bacterium]